MIHVYVFINRPFALRLDAGLRGHRESLRLRLRVLAKAAGGDDAECLGKVAREVDKDRRCGIGETDVEQEGCGLCVCNSRLEGVSEHRGPACVHSR